MLIPDVRGEWPNTVTSLKMTNPVYFICGLLFQLILDDLMSFILYTSNYVCSIHLQDCSTFILKLYGLLTSNFLSFYNLLTTIDFFLQFKRKTWIWLLNLKIQYWHSLQLFLIYIYILLTTFLACYHKVLYFTFTLIRAPDWLIVCNLLSVTSWEVDKVCNSLICLWL